MILWWRKDAVPQRIQARRKFYEKGFHIGPEKPFLDQFYIVYRKNPVRVSEFRGKFLEEVDGASGYLILRDGAFLTDPAYHTIRYYRQLVAQGSAPPLKFPPKDQIQP